MFQEARITVGLRFADTLEAQVAKTMTANAKKVFMRASMHVFEPPNQSPPNRNSASFSLGPYFIIWHSEVFPQKKLIRVVALALRGDLTTAGARGHGARHLHD